MHCTSERNCPLPESQTSQVFAFSSQIILIIKGSLPSSKPQSGLSWVPNQSWDHRPSQQDMDGDGTKLGAASARVTEALPDHMPTLPGLRWVPCSPEHLESKQPGLMLSPWKQLMGPPGGRPAQPPSRIWPGNQTHAKNSTHRVSLIASACLGLQLENLGFLSSFSNPSFTHSVKIWRTCCQTPTFR